MFVALDCFFKSFFIFVIFYLVVTTYKKYNSSKQIPQTSLHQDFKPFEPIEPIESEPVVVVVNEERPLEPVPSGQPIIATPDNIPSDPMELIGNGTKMLYRGKQIEGQRQLIQENTKQALELKKKFSTKLIQDVIRFEDGTDVFLVYRALTSDADDFLDYFVFWNNQTPYRLSRPEVSSDPSRESIKPTKPYKDIEFIQDVSYPTSLSGYVQERAMAFEKRNTTAGPTAIDSHRVFSPL